MGGRGSYSGKSTSSKSKNTSTQSEHLGLKSQSELEAMYTELGVSDPSKAAEYVTHYTGSGYSGMREGKYPEEVKLIDEVIAKQPKWDGTIYRGMNVGQDFIDNLESTSADSIEFSPISPTSFSSSYRVSKSFSNNGDGIPVVFEMKNKRGSSITHNSNYPEEKEVLHKSGEKYKIKTVTRLSNGSYHVVLEDNE